MTYPVLIAEIILVVLLIIFQIEYGGSHLQFILTHTRTESKR